MITKKDKDMIKLVKNYIDANGMISRGDKIVLGVSGGADSVCMFSILERLRKEYDITLYVVHVHHGIRGSEADEDEAYVRELCGTFNIWYRNFKFDIPYISGRDGVSEEEAGRNARYEVFERVLDGMKADKIAVAHNSDDCVETVLHNLCRGTGIKGMGGIPPVRGNIIRPVMCLSRKQIETYLAQNNIKYRTDSTNLQKEYTRNKIRLELIPYLNGNINSLSGEHILKLAEQLAMINSYVEEEAASAYRRVAADTDDGVQIDIEKFEACHRVIQSEIVRNAINKTAGRLKDITSGHIENVTELMRRGTGKMIMLPYDIECVNIYDKCIIRKKKDNIPGEMCKITVSIPGEYMLKDGSKFIFSLENSPKFKEKMYTKWFDYDKIKNALQIRFRENGDFFEAAMNGHKKLKSYFIDEKVPREQRNTIPLIADGHHILWIVGYRISEAYKITSSTQNVLKVQYCERNGKSDER